MVSNYVYVLSVECSLSAESMCYIEDFSQASDMPPVDVIISFYYSAKNVMFLLRVFLYVCLKDYPEFMGELS